MEVTLQDLESQISDQNLWNDPQRAQVLLKQRTYIGDCIDRYKTIEGNLQNCVELIAEAGQDEDILLEIQKELCELSNKAKKFETECLFSGEHDGSCCFLEINAGAGGTESHDWAEMMLRMYLRFIETLKLKAEIIDVLSGEEAGIKSCVVKIEGHNAYGWLRTESGVHRLVRISPFNAAGKRMTSFASVWVYPEAEDDIVLEIEDKDLRVDTYRASGAGGQHVNKTDSAVRITHMPTKTVSQSQNSRSQHQNRETALTILKSKLYKLLEEEHKENVAQLVDVNKEISWGNQIRNYVFHPYSMVKDLRSNTETSDVNSVMDGNLSMFIENYLYYIKG